MRKIPIKRTTPAQPSLPVEKPFEFELPATYRVTVSASSQEEAKAILRAFLKWCHAGWRDGEPRMLLPGSMAHGIGSQMLSVNGEALK